MVGTRIGARHAGVGKKDEDSSFGTPSNASHRRNIQRSESSRKANDRVVLAQRMNNASSLPIRAPPLTGHRHAARRKAIEPHSIHLNESFQLVRVRSISTENAVTKTAQMASETAAAPGAVKAAPANPGDESSESENETEPARVFHRRVSTSKTLNGSVSFGCERKRFRERART